MHRRRNPRTPLPARPYTPLRSALFGDAGYHIRPGFSEDEGLLGLGPCNGGVPGEGLADPYLLVCLRGSYDLTRGVAGHAALMMQLPLLWEACLSVEALAVGEGVGEGAAGGGGLLPHLLEDGLAGFLALLQLSIRFFEVNHLGNIGVEPAALGAHYEHGPPPNDLAVWDGVTVAG